MYRIIPVLAIVLLGPIPSSVGATSPRLMRPSAAQIRHVMVTTVEASDHREHFQSMGKPITIRDGRGGGTLTAIVGGRFPTADAYGQAVFFWHNTRFIGWDSPYEKPSIIRLWSTGPGAISVKYARYRRKDPLCCPTRKPLVVQSGWSGTMFISNGVPPTGPGGRVKITRLHL